MVFGDFNVDVNGIGRNADLGYSVLRRLIGPTKLEELESSHRYTYPFPLEGGPLVNPLFEGQKCGIDHVFTNLRRTSLAVLPPVSSTSSKLPELWLSDHACLDLRIDLPLSIDKDWLSIEEHTTTASMSPAFASVVIGFDLLTSVCWLLIFLLALCGSVRWFF